MMIGTVFGATLWQWLLSSDSQGVQIVDCVQYDIHTRYATNYKMREYAKSDKQPYRELSFCAPHSAVRGPSAFLYLLLQDVQVSVVLYFVYCLRSVQKCEFIAHSIAIQEDTSVSVIQC
jgi:hypothetical protein